MTRPKPRDPDLEIYRALRGRVHAREVTGYVPVDEILDVIEEDEPTDSWDRWREPK